MIKFEISDENAAKIDTWLKDVVFPAEIAKQKESFTDPKWHPPAKLEAIAKDYWDRGRPYAGAIGGGLTYMFTNTTIGQVQKVKYGEHELDLSDYDSW